MKTRDERYLETNGDHCPNPECGSDDIGATGDFEPGDGVVWQNVSCSDCGEHWCDVYRLIGITEVQ